MRRTYHLIPFDTYSYRTRRVQCNQTGRYHRHKTHEEQYAVARCGQEVLKDEDTSCNEGIANPQWDKNWCHECVRAVPWTDPVKDLWRGKGIEIP